MSTIPSTVSVTITTTRSTRYAIVHGSDFVALPDFGVAARMDPHPSEFSYVASKLRLSETDAKAVWNALNPTRPQYDLGE
jgi:hypothetical protein